MNASVHRPVSSVSGKLHLPGSKSISNRVLMIRALSGLQFEIDNLSDSDDTQHLLKALTLVQQNSQGVIDIGHAGTDMRFLTTFLASQPGTYELTGSERMQQRPIKELVDVLTQSGAEISYKKENGYPPLLISGKKIEGGKATISGHISSQFISSLLLTAPYFTNGLELIITGEVVSIPYIIMTIELMKAFGAEVVWKENVVTVKPVPYIYDKDTFTVESDWSAASYYYSMVALSPVGTSLTLGKLFKNSLQADAVCDPIYNRFGVETQFLANDIIITKTQSPDSYDFEYNFINCPDIAQTVACTCVGFNSPFKLTGLQTLKVKETDRIVALKNELEKFGVQISVTGNAIRSGSKNASGPESEIMIATYNDHRMAMSFAPLSLAFNKLNIEHMEVVSKSYPEFWNDLKKTGFIIEPFDRF